VLHVMFLRTSSYFSLGHWVSFREVKIYNKANLTATTFVYNTQSPNARMHCFLQFNITHNNHIKCRYTFLYSVGCLFFPFHMIICMQLQKQQQITQPSKDISLTAQGNRENITLPNTECKNKCGYTCTLIQIEITPCKKATEQLSQRIYCKM